MRFVAQKPMSSGREVGADTLTSRFLRRGEGFVLSRAPSFRGSGRQASTLQSLSLSWATYFG